MRVPRRHNQPLCGEQVRAKIGQRLPLGAHQSPDAGAPVGKQRIQFALRKGPAFAGALQLDKFTPVIQYQVHIGLRVAVLDVAQIQQRGIVH